MDYPTITIQVNGLELVHRLLDIVEEQEERITALARRLDRLQDAEDRQDTALTEVEARVLDLEQRKVVTEDELGRHVARTLFKMQQNSRYADSLNFVIEE